MQQTNNEKPWYSENWYDEDLINALEITGITVTDENIAKLKEACKHIFDDKSIRNEMLVDMASIVFNNREVGEII